MKNASTDWNFKSAPGASSPIELLSVNQPIPLRRSFGGKENYLEENTFSTGHQVVNVYSKPEHYYEVRSDDSAIDVQIHGK